MTGENIIAGLKAGRQDAFKELVSLFSDRIYNTSLGLVQNSEDAEDISQEVFIEVFRSISNFRKESSLSTWIYRITINKCINFLRKKKRKKRFGYITSLFTNENGNKDIPDFLHPGVVVENEERSKVLFSAISRLKENQKVAFTLFNIDGKNYKEIAEIMSTSVSSVESLIHRAKMNLRKYLSDYYEKLQ